jgi:DNA-binding MarR family transcriptional regulator
MSGRREKSLQVAKSDGERAKEEADEAGYIGEIDEILGFHIRLAHGTVYRHFMESFQFLGMTQKQVSVLWLVSDHPGIAQADLAKRLQLDRATVMAIVNRLAKRKFLVRGESATDGRKQTLKLVPTGATALQDAKRAIRTHEKWLKSRFTAKELKTLIGLLRKIHG